MRTIFALFVCAIAVPIFAQSLPNVYSGPTTPFTFTRFDAEYFPPNGMVYVLGGRVGTATDGSIWEYNPRTQTWTDTGFDMPTPVSNYTICYYQPNYSNTPQRSALIVVGGRDAAGVPTDAVQWFFPENDSFFVDTANPVPRGTQYIPWAAAQYNQKIYATGGFNSGTSVEQESTYVYNPALPSNRWSRLGNMNVPRAYIELVVVDSMLFAIGGDTVNAGSLYATNKVEVMNLNAVSPTWDDASVADMPVAVSQGRAFVHDSADAVLYGWSQQDWIFYIGGGQWPTEDSMIYYYGVAGNAWSTYPDALTDRRRNHAGVFIQGLEWDTLHGVPAFWVIGGRKDSDTPPHLNTSEFFFADRYLNHTAYRHDFETDSFFTHAPNGASIDEWERGAPNPLFINGPNGAFRSTNCWGTNLDTAYSDNVEYYLQSPQWIIPSGATDVHVWMMQYVSFEQNWDAANAKISVNGGSYTLLDPAPWVRQYDGVCASGPHWMQNDSVWWYDDSLFWDMMCFDLSPFAGDTVVVRFNIGTDSSVRRPGWYIDDFVLFSNVAISAPDDRWTVGIPERFTLHQNRPNPFNPTTTVAFETPTRGHVRLDVFDVLGRKVATLVDAELPAGSHSVLWNARDVASGTYFARMTAGEFTATTKMTLVK